MPLPDALELRPPEPFDVELSPPGSKSLSNRALLLAALAQGRSTLRGLLDADDTRHMRTCLAALGVPLHDAGESVLEVEGQGGRLRSPAGTCPTLHVGTAGTVARLLGA
ncbi:MAG: 3-phosphoshikimate 1-carboxyvinyltransferase, partial [Myxococcales bacterium]|nr:3-phosphoshikimate 1-carboxyvinyltransferase [Myxococcales bacterium]